MSTNNGNRRLRAIQGTVATVSGALVLVAMAMTSLHAQQPFPPAPTPANGAAPLVDPALANFGPMKVQPQGFWCQVIMANAKWLVIQDETGKQYPVSAQMVNQFLVRWPTNLNQLTPSSLLEANGLEQGNNSVKTDHIDVFESDAYALVTPTVTANFGFNSLVNPASLGLQGAFGGITTIVNPLIVGELAQPSIRTVVGQVVSTSPLQVSLGANNFATLVPATDAGVSMTRVTLGSTANASMGDVVFISPQAFNTKSVAAYQIVLYKRVPFGG